MKHFSVIFVTIKGNHKDTQYCPFLAVALYASV